MKLFNEANKPSMKASFSASVKRTSGCKMIYRNGGMSPRSIIFTIYSADKFLVFHSEKFNTFLPLATSLWTSHEIGAILLYHGHSVWLLWHEKQERTAVCRVSELFQLGSEIMGDWCFVFCRE